MIRRKTVLTIIVLIVTIVAVMTIIFFVVGDSNKLVSIDSTEIKEIIIHNPAEYYTITEQDDIQLLFNTLQSMKLRKTLNSNKEGFSFLIDIELKNGEILNISILSDDINMNGHNYDPDKDYSDIIRELFNKLSKKYEINPA